MTMTPGEECHKRLERKHVRICRETVEQIRRAVLGDGDEPIGLLPPKTPRPNLPTSDDAGLTAEESAHERL